MTSSRLVRGTAKIATAITQADFAPRRTTRSFAASLQAFAYNGLETSGEAEKENVKSEESGDDVSSLSSAGSVYDLDIEDLPFGRGPSRKRKREVDSLATGVTTISTTTSTRTSPRKQGVKLEYGTIGKPGKARKAKRQPAKRIVNAVGAEEVQPPGDWEEIYEAVREMRREKLAPVDTMGCETLAEEHRTPRDKRFQILIALMLSSQTKDTTNAIAMRRLQTELPSPGLTLENILAVEPTKLNEMIFVVGFHNNKTKYIKAAALILRDQYGGDIPDTIEGLMSLPGVGPKMAYLCLSAAWGRTEGIGVDVHVHRITNLWGWHKTKGPEETRAALEAWLPKDRWHEINHLLVGFGQTICLPVGRKCEKCTLSEKGLCPSAVLQTKTIAKRVKREEVKWGDAFDLVEVKKAEEVVIKGEELVIKEEDSIV